MGIRRNKTFVEQATEAVEAAVETAREKAAPVFAEALEKASEVLAEAQEKAGPALADAKDKAAPMISDAKDKAVPMMTAGAAAAARGAAVAADVAAQKAAEGRDFAAAKAAELESKSEKKHRLRTFLVLTGIAALLGFIVKKMTSGSKQDNWQSSYTPAPPPGGRPSTGASDTPIADAAAAASADQPNDEGGAGPDEVLADAVEEAHPVTTPDEPAEVVDLAPDEEAAGKSSGKG